MFEQRAVAIVNPTAGSGRTGRRWPQLDAALRRHWPSLDVVFTTGRGHAVEATRAALEGGASRVLAVGGDGTANEVLRGFLDADGHNRHPDAELGLLLGGTGGDALRHLGCTSVAQQLAWVISGEGVPVDYGLLHFEAPEPRVHAFLNEASVGLSAEVVRRAAEGPRRVGPRLHYAWAAVREMMRHRDLRVRVGLDEQPPFECALSLAVASHGRFFGGGMRIAPRADNRDGAFELQMAGGYSRWGLLGLLARVYGGRHVGMRGVVSTRARVASFAPLDDLGCPAVEADGDLVGRLPVRMSVVRRGIRLRMRSTTATAGPPPGQ